jgi:hypothetical protein
MLLGMMSLQAVLFQGGPAESGKGINIVVGLMWRGTARIKFMVRW